MTLAAAFLAAFAAALATALAAGVATTLPPLGRVRRGISLRRTPPVRRYLAAGAAAVVAAAATGIPAAGAAGFALGWAWSRQRDASRRTTAEHAVVTAWPDALRQVTATTRSGASVAKALEELAVSGPAALRPAMATFAVRAQVVGVSAALGLLRADLADPVTDRVVEILVPAHERGGSIVPQILDALAEATAADLRVVEELRAAGLEQRLNAHIVVAVPWVILALLTLRDGPYREFYGSPAGGWVIVTGLLLTLTGGFLVRRWGRVPTEPRVLRSSP